ncbi:MAG TPA: hypothetical protein VE982_03970 [Gaiellaceae bacterium]|nr:hypothetical protein [Gaiellaceae bacterium]
MSDDAFARVESAQFGPASYVVSALGDLDAQSDELRARLVPLAEIHGARLVLDVAGAYGVGGETVAAITEVAELLASRSGRRLVIVARDPWTKRVLTDAGIDRQAHIATTLTGGLAHAAA